MGPFTIYPKSWDSMSSSLVQHQFGLYERSHWIYNKVKERKAEFCAYCSRTSQFLWCCMKLCLQEPKCRGVCRTERHFVHWASQFLKEKSSVRPKMPASVSEQTDCHSVFIPQCWRRSLTSHSSVRRFGFEQRMKLRAENGINHLSHAFLNQRKVTDTPS